jgi:hypothetical protein
MIYACCATHAEIKKELEEVVAKECEARIMLVPDLEMEVPPTMELNRFKRITIQIEWWRTERANG